MKHGLTRYVRGKCRCEVCRTAKRASERSNSEQRECRTCGASFRPTTAASVTKGEGIYCSRQCAGAWRSRTAKRDNRQSIRNPEHPLAMRNGRVPFHRYVLYERIGPGTHSCHWCGDAVTWANRGIRGAFNGDLLADHLDGHITNNSAANLVPACNNCNTVRALAASWERRKQLPLSQLLPHLTD